MNWREVYTNVMLGIEDSESISISELLILSFCEMILNLVLLKTRSVVKEADNEIEFLAGSIVPGMSYLPVVNVHDLLEDVSLIISAKDENGLTLDRAGFNSTTSFEDLISLQTGAISFYTVGATLFGLRPMPTVDIDVVISYIPYIEVNDLDEIIPLREEYETPIEEFLASLIFTRIGSFERAVAKFDDAMGHLKNVRQRAFR